MCLQNLEVCVVIITDPVRELVGSLELLRGSSSAAGHKFLAEKFDVQEWSRDFYRLVYVILDRIEDVELLIQKLELFDDERKAALGHCSKLKPAFAQQSMISGWNTAGLKHISSEHLGALKMLSPQIRKFASFNKPSGEELAEVIIAGTELKGWLEELQLSERDFVRQALISGLAEFLFRAERLQWLGYGYCMDSLREVITAYMALERGEIDPAVHPDISGALKRVEAFIKCAYSKLAGTKGAVETADWVLRAYGATTLLVERGVVGLLASQ